MTKKHYWINVHSLDGQVGTYSSQPAQFSCPNAHLAVTSREDLGAVKSRPDAVVAECSDDLIVAAACANSLVQNAPPLPPPHLAIVAPHHRPYLAATGSRLMCADNPVGKMAVPTANGLSND
jgi:hypothetical protein